MRNRSKMTEQWQEALIDHSTSREKTESERRVSEECIKNFSRKRIR